MTGLVALLVSIALVGQGAGTSDFSLTSETLSYGDRGPAVEALNDALATAGFNPDGGSRFGAKTRHAVFAFQKHYGFRTTGRFTPLMWALLDEPIELPWRSNPDRVEVDLGKQVLYVVEDQRVALILPISSGNGRSYRAEDGTIDTADTPEGRFRFQRRVLGMREAFLGQMYYPYYFYQGYAIHGSPSVPNYPASHGCIRVTMWDMDLLLHHFKIGQRVYIYGDRTDPPPAGIDKPAPRYISLMR